ncbi:MAG: hypothetical protein DWQ07_02005 [Chloroflexi bacterium]|nr:MAG: hypothetical protein DWQ07_02005 [Chloroflexota bacterium]MBL1193727.1 hypothetical protein [Chloroflexota bacterium]NOH11020.1 hypothetical protein [Chloroflexota bacterium]
MSKYQYTQYETEPTPRRSRTALRAILMVGVAGLILLLILLLLSNLVSPIPSDPQALPTASVLDATQTPEAPQPAVVPLDSTSGGGNSEPEALPETGNQFIAASGSSSGLFGQLTTETLSDFQTCSNELEYTARIDDVWDIWDLIFFTIYANQDNVNSSPPTCHQLALEFSSNGRAEFISALGANWWAEGSFSNPSLISSNCATPTECVIREEAEKLLQLEGNTYQAACQRELVPPGLCSEFFSASTQECVERYDWTGAPEELKALVIEEYVNNLGDVPQACVLYAGLPFLANETIQQTAIGIQNGATCASQNLGCEAIQNPVLDITRAQACAANIQWAGPITNDTEAIELIEYLAATAPWLPPGTMPPSCTQLLISASHTEAGATYWELLGKTLSKRRIDSGP